jgi:hypothetical protein
MMEMGIIGYDLLCRPEVNIACHNRNYFGAKCELPCAMAMLTMGTINLVVMDSKEKVIFC